MELGGYGVGRIGRDIGDGDGGAGLSEGVGEGATDALTGAGNEGDATVEAEAVEDGGGGEDSVVHDGSRSVAEAGGSIARGRMAGLARLTCAGGYARMRAVGRAGCG